MFVCFVLFCFVSFVVVLSRILTLQAEKDAVTDIP